MNGKDAMNKSINTAKTEPVKSEPAKKAEPVKSEPVKKDANVVIVVNEPRAIVLPKAKVGSKYAKNVEYSNGKTLLPGENDIPLSYWNDIKGNPAVKIYLACEAMINKGAGKAKPILGSLDKMKTHKAIGLIESCTDVSQLKTWMKNSNENIIKKAIKQQINELIENEDGEAAEA